jgi:hypothetical protein
VGKKERKGGESYPLDPLFGGGYLLEISIHNGERQMIAIHICFDGKLLGIVEGFLTSLQPMSDGAHDTLVAQSRGNAREHFFCLPIFLLSRFVPDLMCISFELDEKVVDCLLKITRSRY